jgi:glycolate oxidase iron-sulfur subunit
MQTHLAPEFLNTRQGQEAESILRKCVHCGFCTATCPTYQLLGDELDGPRGRIYLIKQMLEGAHPTQKTQLHLDRCLTCRNCETTCPSGVQYGRLIDIGRDIAEKKVPRAFTQQLLRASLRRGLTSPWFAPAMRLGQWMRPLLPGFIKAKVPALKPTRHTTLIPQVKTLQELPQTDQAVQSRVLLLAGCVQPAMAPNINSATARVMHAMGTQVLYAQGAGCCGALSHHLNAQEEALDQIRRNIDAWYPLLEQGVEALVMTASGCGVSVKEYGHMLAHDPAYQAKALRVSQATLDLSEWIATKDQGLEALKLKLDIQKISSKGLQAYHPPCTLQHGQKLRDSVQIAMQFLGFDVALAPVESHLCCGSAGTYSVLNPGISTSLKERKLNHLQALKPKAILSANVGCISHLQSGTELSVQHWIELIDECLIEP